jgi:hypothetical protein
MPRSVARASRLGRLAEDSGLAILPMRLRVFDDAGGGFVPLF